MNEKRDFALVRRPSSAVEKTAPGTKRILSGMVGDTLALTKPVFIVAACGYCDEWLHEQLAVFFQETLTRKYTVKVELFIYEDELIKAASQKSFELFLVFLNPNLPRKHDQPDTLNQADTLEFIANLKLRFQKPIFIISNEYSYSRTLSPLFMAAGANAFMGMPFSPDEIYEAMTSSGMNPKRREK